jgi:hypothetical protein
MTGDNSNILELKRWRRVPYRVSDTIEISMELKRLRRHEARPLQKLLTKVFAKLEDADGLSPSQKTDAIQEIYDLMPEDDLKRWFGECVRGVQGLFIDGDAVTSGAALFEEADDQCVLFTLMNLFRLSRLSAVQGNESASLSTSSPQSEARSSATDAGAIESSGGTPLLTAEVIQAVPVSSSESVEA